MLDVMQRLYFVTTTLVLLAGVYSIVITIPKVKSHRKPLYWIALPCALTLLTIHVYGGAREFGLIARSGGRLLIYALEVVLFVVGLLFILVPYVDRLEADHLDDRGS